MRNIKLLLLTTLLYTVSLYVKGQDVSFIALGDMHYDRLQDHDPDYVMTRPQDYEQIFKEYPQYTFFMPRFLQLIKKQATVIEPRVKAIVQLGDLVEGVSGNLELARQMNRGVVNLLDTVRMPVPWCW